MINDPIGDDLHRLSKEFRKLAGKPSDTDICEKLSPEKLSKYGLTFDEAKAWLGQEPNFVRRNFTKEKSDKDLTKPG